MLPKPNRFFYLSIYLVAMLCAFGTYGQELPILNQRLTNSFVYNPAQAGLELGSIAFIHKRNWNDAEGAPVSNILSAHHPFAKGRVGVGLNVISDKTNIYSTTYGSAAFAYHVLFDEFTTLSFGLSAEFSDARIDASRVNVADQFDERLIQAMGQNNFNNDYSFGLNFRAKYFGVGGAYNRLSSSFIVNKSEAFLQDYFTGYANLTIPIAQRRDFFEPMVSYRKLSTDKGQLDVGAYYTFNDLFTFGGSYGDQGIWNLQVGMRFANFYLGYVYEDFAGKTNKDLGGNNEVMLRFDFSRGDSYRNRYANFAEKSKNAAAYRRKTLSRPPVGGRSPKKLSRKLKRNNKEAYNPNKRYNTKKLYSKKKFKPKKSRRKGR